MLVNLKDEYPIPNALLNTIAKEKTTTTSNELQPYILINLTEQRKKHFGYLTAVCRTENLIMLALQGGQELEMSCTVLIQRASWEPAGCLYSE